MSVYLKYLLETSKDNTDLEKRLNKIDYYSILGLNKNSSSDEIYTNFKKLLEYFKPTFSSLDNFEKKSLVYTFILNAYSTLSNPLKKAEYNEMLDKKQGDQIIKFTQDEQGIVNIQDDELLGRVVNLLGKSLNCSDFEVSNKAKEDIVSMFRNVQKLLSTDHVVLYSNELSGINSNKCDDIDKDLKYNVFDEQYCPEVLIPIDLENSFEVVSSNKKEVSVSLFKLLKEKIENLRPKNKKDVFNYTMCLLLAVMAVAGFYLETERLKKEFSSFDYKQALANIQTMVEELNEKTELTINYDITAEDTKKSLSKYSGISYKEFEDIDEFDEGDTVSFIYKVLSHDLKRCSKTVVVGENDSQNIGGFCEKYNTNIQTLIYLNPELFGDYEDIDEYFISHPVMYQFSKPISSLKIPDIESIKNYDVENDIVYQKVKKDV